MVGIRNSWTEGFGTRWLDPDAFAWFWGGVERLGIPLMILPPGGASALAPIAQRYPGITLIIDHLGLRPTRALRREVPTDGGPFARFDEVLDLARFPQVMVKFSDLPNLSAEPFPYPAMTPYLERAFDAYGPQRIMWGSDYTMLTAGGHTYRDCLDHVRTLSFLTDDDREWVLAKTAASALNWPI
jgi:predicted TIM-barrel fold metal-dependent hydrolase